MRILRRTLIALGMLDLLIAGVCVVLHAAAFSSQYSGFVVWITRLQGVEPGQAGYEESRVSVLNLLGRTSAPTGVVLLALAITGAVCVGVGLRMGSVRARRGAGDVQ